MTHADDNAMIIERKQGQDQRPESASMLSVGADTVSSFIIFLSGGGD